MEIRQPRTTEDLRNSDCVDPVDVRLFTWGDTGHDGRYVIVELEDEGMVSYGQIVAHFGTIHSELNLNEGLNKEEARTAGSYPSSLIRNPALF